MKIEAIILKQQPLTEEEAFNELQDNLKAYRGYILELPELRKEATKAYNSKAKRDAAQKDLFDANVRIAKIWTWIRELNNQVMGVAEKAS